MNGNTIAKLESAKLMLQEAKTLQEVKSVMNIADAAKVYAKQAKLGQEAVNYAHEIKLRAERKLGGMLLVSPKNKGQILRGSEMEPRENIPTLNDIGISKKESMDAQQLAKIKEEVFEKIVVGEKTLDEVKRELKRMVSVVKINEISRENKELKTDKKYPVILCDPPWKYDYSASSNRDIENQYPTMELHEISALPVEQLASEDAVIFMWVTSPKLFEGMELIHQWGFNYRTCMVWVKDKIGMGYYARQRHELLLIGARGELPVPQPENRPDSVIESPRNAHSQKPDVLYSLIEKMYPEFEKIELFSRNKRDGWNSWGNQA